MANPRLNVGDTVTIPHPDKEEMLGGVVLAMFDDHVAAKSHAASLASRYKMKDINVPYTLDMLYAIGVRAPGSFGDEYDAIAIANRKAISNNKV